MGDKNEIIFKYVFDDQYEPEYINGAYGGVNTSGELIVNFFMERFALPRELKQTVNKDGTLDERSINVLPENPPIRRVVKSGIVMSSKTSLTVYRWMKERLVEMGVSESEL